MSDFVLTSGEGEHQRLHLGAQLTILEAAELREALMEALTSCRDLVLDVSAVIGVDASGLQCLCAAHRSATAQSTRIRVTGLDAGPWPEVLKISGFKRHEACPLSDDHKNCLWL